MYIEMPIDRINAFLAHAFGVAFLAAITVLTGALVLFSVVWLVRRAIQERHAHG